MDLKTLDLLALQTQIMQTDKTTQGMCAALTPQFQQLAVDADKVLLWSNIDNLPEEILDELAWALHLDFYDPDADITAKRYLVKNAHSIHATKGTPYAVKQAIYAYFGEGDILEWFNYGGQPYHFMIYVRDQAALTDKYDQFIKTLNAVKNTRSHLERILSINRICGVDQAPVLFGAICSEESYL